MEDYPVPNMKKLFNVLYEDTRMSTATSKSKKKDRKKEQLKKYKHQMLMIKEIDRANNLPDLSKSSINDIESVGQSSYTFAQKDSNKLV